MKRTRLSVAAAGLLAVGLTFGATPAAQAAVTAKDVPTGKEIAKAVPEFEGVMFNTAKSKEIGLPGKGCGPLTVKKVKSAVTTTGANASGAVVIAGVAEFKSVADAKKSFTKYKKYVKKCKAFTIADGMTGTQKVAKAPKVGDDRFGVVKETDVFGTTTHGRSVLIRTGKRMAEVSAGGPAKISAKKLTKLAKVAAKKMK